MTGEYRRFRYNAYISNLDKIFWLKYILLYFSSINVIYLHLFVKYLKFQSLFLETLIAPDENSD